MTGDDDDLRGLRLLQLARELDALAVGETQIGQQHVRTLPPQLDARITQTMGSRNRKAFHARDFLQPVHDVRIVVDYQSVCHLIPLT